MQVNPEDGPPEIYVTCSDPRMTDFENPTFSCTYMHNYEQASNQLPPRLFECTVYH